MFTKESDYSEENANSNDNFRSTIFQPFQLGPQQKKTCSKASTADLLTIRIGNLNSCKCAHCKNEAGKTGCLPQCKGCISPPAFMDYCPTTSHTC